MEYLIFDEEVMITHMCSKEGEKVPLQTKVNPTQNPVEIWCKEVEISMVKTVKHYINVSVED